MNYYNEFDRHAAAWLKELIKAGLIPHGEVDERSIADVKGAELEEYTQCHFFAGIGGWCEALRLAGWPSTRSIWTGSCPCQPFSAAGQRKGAKDSRHLWPEMFRLIRECRPSIVFGEQVEAAIRHGWLDGICADMEGEDYAVGAHVLGAHSVGAPHIRQRLFWVAYAECSRRHDGRRIIQKCDDKGARIEATERSMLQRETQRHGNARGLANAESGRCGEQRRETVAGRSGHVDGGIEVSGWRRVVFSCECDEDGNCPNCAIEYSECGRIGPTQDGCEYEERDGILYGRLVQSGKPGLEGLAGYGDKRHESGRVGADAAGSTAEAGATGWIPDATGAELQGFAPAWNECGNGKNHFILCRDNKIRRIASESALQPLADGFKGSRVGLLRGAGNAIVPQVAAQFIMAAFPELEGAEC